MERLSKLWLSLALLFLAHELYGQITTCNQLNQSLTSASAGPVYNNSTQLKCSIWKLVGFNSGLTNITVQVEGAQDNNGSPGAFSAFGAAVTLRGSNPSTCAANCTIIMNISDYRPWLRVNMTAATGTGSFNFNLIGASSIGNNDVTFLSSGGSSVVTAIGPDATGTAPTQNPVQISVFDGTNVRRLRSGTTGNLNMAAITAGADGVGNGSITSMDANSSTLQPMAVAPFFFNGGNWERPRTSTANTRSGFNNQVSNIGLITEIGPRFSLTSNPAAGTQATVTRAATGGVQYVADCIAFSASASVAPVASTLTINLRDGASGAGTVLWSYTIFITAAIGEEVSPHSFCGLNIMGTGGTAMTLEFSAGLANLSESVNLTFYGVQ
jgi:hypothetical protein